MAPIVFDKQQPVTSMLGIVLSNRTGRTWPWRNTRGATNGGTLRSVSVSHDDSADDDVTELHVVLILVTG